MKNALLDLFALAVCFSEYLEFDCASNDEILVLDDVTCTALCGGVALLCDV